MLEKIAFPEHEYESVQNWLNKQGYCYTTRVFKEVGKHKVGESYLAPWGDVLRIDDVQIFRKVSDRPFYDAFSPGALPITRNGRMESCFTTHKIKIPMIRITRLSSGIKSGICQTL